MDLTYFYHFQISQDSTKKCGNCDHKNITVLCESYDYTSIHESTRTNKKRMQADSYFVTKNTSRKEM